MRLLYCNACKTLDEIPDYDGQEEVDPLVEVVVREHNMRDPMAHGGQRVNPMRLAVVDDLEWQFDREKIIEQINRSNKQVGFDPWVGEAHNTFREDAHKCWVQHRQPDLGAGKACIDYWDESKRIGRPTAIGRQIVKENEGLGKTDPHLCQWCPYYSGVVTEVRFKKGQYKEGG